MVFPNPFRPNTKVIGGSELSTISWSKVPNNPTTLILSIFIEYYILIALVSL